MLRTLLLTRVKIKKKYQQLKKIMAKGKVCDAISVMDLVMKNLSVRIISKNKVKVFLLHGQRITLRIIIIRKNLSD